MFGAQRFVMPGSPFDLDVADVDGDGRLDIVTANQDDRSIGVLAGEGTGLFTFSHFVSIPSGVQQIRLADIEGDGDPDVITLSEMSTLEVRRNDGSGSFAPPAAYNTLSLSTTLTVADITNNGVPDIVVGSDYSQAACIFHNDGAGHFAYVGLCVVGWNVSDIVADDLNHDGWVDLFVTDRTKDQSIVLYNDQGGSFAGQTIVDSGFANCSAGDVDGDGDIDIMCARLSFGLFLRQSDGTYSLPMEVLPDVIADVARLVDLDNDGDLDLVGAYRSLSYLVTAMNNGDGTFNAPIRVASIAFSGSISIGDVNGDGYLDAIGPDPGSNSVDVLFNDRLGRLGGAERRRLDTSEAASPNVMADLSGDGIDDLLMRIGGDLVYFINDGTGVFNKASSVPLDSSSRRSVTVDVDDDGDLDVAIPVGDSLTILENLGGASLQVQQSILLPYGIGNLSAGDFNADGHPDFAICAYFADMVQVVLSTAMNQYAEPAAYSTIDRPSDIATAQLDSDEDVDLVLISTAGSVVQTFINDGAGAFDSTQMTSIGIITRNMAVGDMDGDGLDDVASGGDEVGAGIKILRNVGGGVFTLSSTLAEARRVYGLEMTDLDADDDEDLLVLSSDAIVSVYINDGHASFVRIAQLATQEYNALTSSDVNGDGAVDVVVFGASGQYSLALNRCGVLECNADLNGDESVDVVDLLDLLGDWAGPGPGASLAPPLDTTDVFDLLVVLSDWGPCG